MLGVRVGLTTTLRVARRFVTRKPVDHASGILRPTRPVADVVQHRWSPGLAERVPRSERGQTARARSIPAVPDGDVSRRAGSTPAVAPLAIDGGSRVCIAPRCGSTANSTVGSRARSNGSASVTNRCERVSTPIRAGRAARSRARGMVARELDLAVADSEGGRTGSGRCSRSRQQSPSGALHRRATVGDGHHRRGRLELSVLARAGHALQRISSARDRPGAVGLNIATTQPKPQPVVTDRAYWLDHRICRCRR